ncbi:MAG: ATP-binding protein [Desulfoprunum sp.]|jgi:signal transduction histidine kinase|uniref:ATP-binding protein n=1 Tax=Desulfoprunum sp. TaxID=2020866 RepID=UPI00052E08EF|nr:hypothetical protein JT06_05995 [Desulfobulbus sp. Tol-SR]
MESRQYDISSFPQPQDPLKHQEIINDILKISLEPSQLKDQLGHILDYLISLGEFEFNRKAAIFLVEPDSELLLLTAARGFSEEQGLACRKVRFGLCHCGQTARDGKAGFFASPPPLSMAGSTFQSAGGHYCVPIIKDGTPSGVMVIYGNHHHSHTPATAQLLESIANILATVIENQRMDQQLINLVNDLRISIINLREEKKFSDSIIQGLHHGLLVTDLQGHIIKSNAVAQSILNPFAATLDCRLLADILGRKKAAEILNDKTQQASKTENEITLITPTGEQKIISFSTVPREDAKGSKVGYIISLSDISELKYVRKEMEKMNRLSTVAEIASAVAHEVRNPLAGIKIMAQSIEENAEGNEDQLECSRRIIHQVNRLNELLSEFFSYARPVIPNKCPTSLAAILSETIPLINNKLMKRQIKLIQLLSKDLPNIIVDPNQLQQVFLNLILNAIDAIREQGKIEIAAKVVPKNKVYVHRKFHPSLQTDRRYVMVTFSDNGMGMPAATLEKIFEPFFTTKTTGTGLGLSIVYRTLKENDAIITVDSIEGRMTTFTMFFQVEE